ncbi:MAG: hypothetical protein V9G11_00960 [Bifidobacterium adolescentis]
MIAASGIIPLLILPRERSSKDDGDGKSGAEAAKEALENLLPPKLKGAHDFYKACGGLSAHDGQLRHDLPVHAVHLRKLCWSRPFRKPPRQWVRCPPSPSSCP